MQINLHNYCSFTQWMSSELTAINPETFGSQLTPPPQHVLSGSGNSQEALFQSQVATEVYIYIYGFKNNCTHWLTLIWLFS
jgi:hypothetical protein